ncbi:MAG: DUF6240 domain-containing protein [Lachnospiraceae bacterium]|nr:DUF6240 domain-containing protein [Lachnospiraceae bacterium]
MAKAYGMQDNAVKSKADGIVMDIGEGSKAAHGFKGVSESKGIKGGKKDLLSGVSSFDAKNAHNYMAVMSNTMSEKDFRAMQEEGYQPGRMSEAEAVTGLDRIKVILAESGVNVAGFTDTVDRETAAEITGSVAAANKITSETPVNSGLFKDEEALKDYAAAGFEAADLPKTDENIRSAVNAFRTAAKIEPLDAGSMEYLLSNAEEPTIENVYMAEHSGSGSGSGGAKGYFDNEGTGYLSEIAENDDLEALSGQIESIIENAGLEPDENIRKDAEYLIKAGFALNPDTLNLYEDLKSLAFPLKAGDVMQEICEAVARGDEAGNAYLIKGYNLIKNERILNETRLKMNSEANRSMDSDNGFALDTEGLSDRVDELKIKEQAFYRAAFMRDGAEDAASIDEKVSLAEETLFKVSEIKNMPAAVIGSFSSAEAFTVNDVYEAGNELKLKFEAANMTYEAVGTEVRADLGDRIGNAFRNAGELLHELGIKETEENLRAVRILGYNSMEINEKNIADVKAADQTVRTLINRLTGAATVSLIREGVNPLHTGMQELIDKVSEMQGLTGENEKFSEYLFRLERSHEISEDEATSYIGIYRLLRQVENSDGAVIGSLVNSGKELSLKNLLTELRTRGKGHMDFSIGEDFGGVTEAEDASRNMKIDAQIETAFHNESDDEMRRERQYAENLSHELYDSLSPEKLPDISEIGGDTILEDLADIMRRNTPGTNDVGTDQEETDMAFAAEESGEIREAALKEDNVYEMLLRYGQEITPENVNAMASLMNDRGAYFNELINILGENIRDRIKSRSEKILEKMGDISEEASEADPADDVKEAYGEMAEETEAEIREASENADKYLDIKALQSLNRRLTVAKSLSRAENYEIPMEIGGRLTSVNVKIIRGTGESKAAVSFETEEFGQVYGEFTLSEGRIGGLVTSSTDQGSERLRSVSEGFLSGLDRAGIDRGDIIFEKSLSGDINRIPETADIKSIRDKNTALPGTDRVETNGSESMDAESNPAVLYRTAKIFIVEVNHAH